MVARVLVISGTRLWDGSAARRIERALRGLGHAVRVVSVCDARFDSIFDAVRLWMAPDLVFIDSSCGNAGEIARSLGVQVFGFGGRGDSDGGYMGASIPVFQDDSYRCATTSLPTEGRETDVLITQEPTEMRQRLLSSACANKKMVSLVSGYGASEVNPYGGAGAHEARCAKVALQFDGDDAPSLIDVALRMAEGCLVLGEQSLVERLELEGLPPCIPAFSEASLKEVLDRTCENAEYRERLIAQQQAWLDELPCIDSMLSDLLAGSLSGDEGSTRVCRTSRAKNIVVYGWLGMDNFGDDLLLQVVADRVRERFPESVIQVIAGNAQRVEELCGFEAVVAGDYAGMRRLISQADALIFCGGLIFDDPMSTTAGEIELFMEPFINPACQAAACLMAWQHGVPAFYLGAGLGPVAKPATREALRYIGLAGARLLLRDQDSVDLALKSGVPSAQVGAYADLVLSAHDTVVERASDDLPEGLQPGGYITVALRDWPLNPAGFEEALAAELDRVSEQTGLAVAFVPFDPDDVHIHHRVAERMRAKMVVEIASRLAMPEMLSVVKHSAMAVAMRLHCSILHHVLGKPAIGLDYNEKVGSHFREMGRGAYLIPLDSVAGSLSTAALRASADPEVTRRQIEEGLASLTPKVEEAFRELFSAIEGHEPAPRETEVFYPRARSQAAVDLEASRAREQALSARVTQLQGELDAARARISDLEQSTSYRLGHALVKVPHALFRGR